MNTLKKLWPDFFSQISRAFGLAFFSGTTAAAGAGCWHRYFIVLCKCASTRRKTFTKITQSHLLGHWNFYTYNFFLESRVLLHFFSSWQCKFLLKRILLLWWNRFLWYFWYDVCWRNTMEMINDWAHIHVFSSFLHPPNGGTLCEIALFAANRFQWNIVANGLPFFKEK